MLCFGVCSWIFCFISHLGVICSTSSLVHRVGVKLPAGVVCFILLLVHWMSITVHHWMLCGSFCYRSTRCVKVHHWMLCGSFHYWSTRCVTVHHWMLCGSFRYRSTGCVLQFITGCCVVHFATGPLDVRYSSSLDVVWFISLQVHQMCVTVHHWMLCGSRNAERTAAAAQDRPECPEKADRHGVS